MRLHAAVGLVVVGALVLTACQEGSPLGSRSIAATGVTVTAPASYFLSYMSGSLLQLTAAVLPADATNQKIIWTAVDTTTGGLPYDGSIDSTGLWTSNGADTSGEQVTVTATVDDFWSLVRGSLQIQVSGS